MSAPICKLCRQRHYGHEVRVCKLNRQSVANAEAVANTVANVQKVANRVVANGMPGARNKHDTVIEADGSAHAVNKHGQYADKEKRRAYMRDLMRKARAKHKAS